MFFDKIKNSTWMKYTLGACITVIVYLVLGHLPQVMSAIGSFLNLLSPVIYGVVLAYLLTPLIDFLYDRAFKKIKKDSLRLQLSNIGAIVLVVLVFLWMMSGFIPQVIESIVTFFSNFNSYAQTLQDALQSIVDFAHNYNIDLDALETSSVDLLQSLVGFISENTSRIAQSSINFTSNAIDLFLGVVLMLYFLAFKPSIVKLYFRVLNALFKEATYKKVTAFLAECNKITKTYIVSDIIDGLIILLVTLIFMTITGMPYAMVISLLVGITNLLPTIGPFIGAFGGAFILLFVSSPLSVLIFLIFIFILQQIDGYVIKPRLFGDALGVEGVWITLSIIVGAKFFGFVGVILAVPFMAIFQLVVNRALEKKERQKAAAGEGVANSTSKSMKKLS